MIDDKRRSVNEDARAESLGKGDPAPFRELDPDFGAPAIGPPLVAGAPALLPTVVIAQHVTAFQVRIGAAGAARSRGAKLPVEDLYASHQGIPVERAANGGPGVVTEQGRYVAPF